MVLIVLRQESETFYFHEMSSKSLNITKWTILQLFSYFDVSKVDISSEVKSLLLIFYKWPKWSSPVEIISLNHQFEWTQFWGRCYTLLYIRHVIAKEKVWIITDDSFRFRVSQSASVSVSEPASTNQDPETEAANWNSAIVHFIIYTPSLSNSYTSTHFQCEGINHPE